MRKVGTVGVIKFTYPLDEGTTGSNHPRKDKQEKGTFPYRLYANLFYYNFDILVFSLFIIWHNTDGNYI